MALRCNAGLAVDVPTGHGFCMLIRQDVLRRVGRLDEGFGRGYGEENDFCNRAADLGYRNVAAGGALVLHHESISFTDEKAGLLARNMPQLEARYPEYTPTIMEVERRDDLRAARWRLDEARLRRAVAAGARFALVVRHGLGGGTDRAIGDIEASVGYGGAEKLDLSCRADGFIELSAMHPALHAVFAPDEMAALVAVLQAAEPTLVVVHQLLGFPEAFLAAIPSLIEGRHSVCYVHDFYPLCPRVTMINAVGQFCRLASSEVCGRCVKAGGAHELSRLTALTPAEHRALFADLLSRFSHVVTPSEDSAGYLRAGLPQLAVTAVPHPAPGPPVQAALRQGGDGEVVLFGAIGPHKGSARLLKIARLAMLQRPDLRFRVIGYTDIDEALLKVGNVAITGAYEEADLPLLVADCTGRLALFLSEWPETFSYTLSEAVRWGFTPLVPDIGAPAERVRQMGLGRVFPFPISAAGVLRAIADALDSGAGSDKLPDGQAAAAFAISETRRVLGVA
jgi:glycosyltransferase involved in cell wall biosynthesis